MDEEDVLEIENQINVLEKEFKNLEKAYAQKDGHGFEKAKECIATAQKIIKGAIK